MPTQINININGFPRQVPSSPDTDNGDRRLLEYSERQWQDDNFYTLLPGFSPVGYLHGERKVKAKKQKKKCTSGQVCGFSCISKTKVCLADMTTKQFMEHNKAKRLAAAEKRKAAKAGAAGATETTEKGGALALLDKKQAEEVVNGPRFKGDRQAEIDKKYASADPSPADVDAWFKETAENLFTADGAKAMVAKDIFFDKFLMEPYALPFIDKVNDERSFIDAASGILADKYSKRQWTAPDGKTYTSTDIEYWRKSMEPFTFAEDQKKYAAAKKIIDNPKKTEEQKAKAQKFIDKHEKQMQESEKFAQMWHGRAVGLASGDKEFARNLAKEFWDEAVTRKQADVNEVLGDFNSKSKRRREYAESWVVKQAYLFTDSNYFMNPADKQYSTEHVREAAKTRLQTRISSPLSAAKTKAELKALFKAYARENHPDKGGDTKQFQAISAQYQDMLTYLN